MSDFLKNIKSQIDQTEDAENKFPELMTMITIIFYCGFKRQEIVSMNIGDVLSADHREWSPFCQKAIDDYIKSLGDNLDANSPLFPQYRGEKKIYRHLKRISDSLGYVTIRDEGIKYTSNELYGDNWRRHLGDMTNFYNLCEDKVRRLLYLGRQREQYKDTYRKRLDRIMESLGNGGIGSEDRLKKIEDAKNIISKMKVSNKQKSDLKEKLISKIIYSKFNDIIEKLKDNWISDKDNAQIINKALASISTMKISNDNKKIFMEEMERNIYRLKSKDTAKSLNDIKEIKKTLDDITTMKISNDNKKIFMEEMESRIVHLFCRKKLLYKELESIFSYLSDDCRKFINTLKL